MIRVLFLPPVRLMSGKPLLLPLISKPAQSRATLDAAIVKQVPFEVRFLARVTFVSNVPHPLSSCELYVVKCVTLKTNLPWLFVRLTHVSDGHGMNEPSSS